MILDVFSILEIKPCGFESTIRDMEAERYKENKSELWNRLTYRVLIYIFEVGMKTQMRNFEVKIPI